MEETKRSDDAAAAAQMRVWIRMRAASHAAAFLHGDHRPVPPPLYLVKLSQTDVLKRAPQ
jgi:hypothetical protein